ncbi:hypothetical protein HanPSC8_Chr03g0132281 [Helianthus annuus]|nr:hypothetical protein HanPSC8_Chr03g0132281 [Helianthus annuus]
MAYMHHMYCKNLFFPFCKHIHTDNICNFENPPFTKQIHAQQQTPFDFPFSLFTHVTGDHDSGSGGTCCRRPSTDATHPHNPLRSSF